MDNGQFFTVKEAAEYLGITEMSVYSAKHLKTLRPDKDASWERQRVCFSREELDRYKLERGTGRGRKKKRPIDEHPKDVSLVDVSQGKVSPETAMPPSQGVAKPPGSQVKETPDHKAAELPDVGISPVDSEDVEGGEAKAQLGAPGSIDNPSSPPSTDSGFEKHDTDILDMKDIIEA